jgi:hypothetical protein
MAKNQEIRLRKEVLKKLFPNPFTKLRPEDFVNKATDNKPILNKREFDALINVRNDMGNRHYSRGFEFIAKRKKKGVELINLDL